MSDKTCELGKKLEMEDCNRISRFISTSHLEEVCGFELTRNGEKILFFENCCIDLYALLFMLYQIFIAEIYQEVP